MTRRVLILWVAGWLLVALVGVALLASDARAGTPAGMLPPSGPFPDAECNEDAVHDIYVGGDGALWECVCQSMIFGPPDCQWYEVPTSEALRIRKRIRARYHVRVVPRLRVIAL